MTKKCYCLFIALFSILTSYSQNIIQVSQKNTSQNIGKYAYFLEDKTGRLSIEDIQQTVYQKKFQKSAQNILNFNTTRSTIWLKIIVENQIDEKIYLEVAQAAAWHIDFYKPNAQGTWTLATRTGIMCPFQDRQVDNNFFLFELDNTPKPQTYYVSIQSDHALTIPLFLASKQAQMEKTTFYNWFLGGFSGLMLIMFFYNLFVFYSVRDKLYLYYCNYLFFSLIIVNFVSGNFGYRLNPLSYFPQYFIVFVALINSSIVIFTTSLLDLPRKSLFYRILWFWLITSWLFASVNIWTGRYVALFDVVQAMALLMSIYILIASIGLYMQGNRNARFVVFGFSFYLLGIIIYILQNFGILVANFFTNTAPVFGTSIEILLFSLALGDKINHIRREKDISQKALLAKTLENEEILQKQNEVLEIGIQERTEELQTMNEELNATVDELSHTLKLLDEKSQIIESINNKLTSSINYAQTIQEAILPNEAFLQTYLPNHCLIYRPKDVVSGDFYWACPLADGLVVAVADCTGHGVAGSFMSLIGINILNNMEQEIAQLAPAQIIYKLNTAVEKVLKQKQRQSYSEGMDIAVCKIQYAHDDIVNITFSGAKRHLYYVQQANKVFSFVKGDRQSIGIALETPPIFTHHQLTLAKGDMVYMWTDGFADQNNEMRKKFGERNLHNLILQCYDKPTETQKEIIECALDAHQKDEEQRDDITLLGIRL